MKLYYKDFLLFAEETNGSIRERLGMGNEDKAGEKEHKEAARLLRAFILSKLEFTRIYYLEDEDLENKKKLINKTKLNEEYSCFPIGISGKRKDYFLREEENYSDLLFPISIDAWLRIKNMGDRKRYSELYMNEHPIFDTDELFLNKESYIRLFEAQYLSCLE